MNQQKEESMNNRHNRLERTAYSKSKSKKKNAKIQGPDSSRGVQQRTTVLSPNKREGLIFSEHLFMAVKRQTF